MQLPGVSLLRQGKTRGFQHCSIGRQMLAKAPESGASPLINGLFGHLFGACMRSPDNKPAGLGFDAYFGLLVATVRHSGLSVIYARLALQVCFGKHEMHQNGLFLALVTIKVRVWWQFGAYSSWHDPLSGVCANRPAP